jgi:TonB family protein
MPPQAQPIFVDAQTLLVEARFRDRTLAARLLTADAARGFTVGAGRAADAPVDVAYLLASRPANDNHVLVEPTGAGFLVNLPEAMRARLQESPGRLRVPCGEVIFDISASASPPSVPRPWLSRLWRKDTPYLVGVAAALLILLGLVSAVPSDPRSISLDDLGRSIRMADITLIPPAPIVVPPPIGPSAGSDGGGPAKVASGPTGAAGDPRAPRRDTRRSTKGPAERQDARDVAKLVEQYSILHVLGSQRATSLTHVLSDTAALGDQAADVLGHIQGTDIASAWGNGGIASRGTGAGGADQGVPMLGGPGVLNTIPGQHGPGTGREYGHNEGVLDGKRKARIPQIIATNATVRGNLDKEIIRRIVRTHLNEIRYCYEQSLIRRPSLTGRVVVQFTIAPTGRVIASVLQSSTIAEPALNSCVVQATRRWEYPRPDGGGLAIVSYPFQLTPAGG